MKKTESCALKVLFICSRNRVRSLTAERLLEGVPGLQVRSAGTQPQSRIVASEGHLRWADLIVLMEKSHRGKLEQRFPGALQDKRVVTLHIPDVYEFMGEDLIDELQGKLACIPGLTAAFSPASAAASRRPA